MYVMANSKTKRKARTETESTYFLKLVLYLVIGSQWLWFVDAGLTKQFPVPAGFLLGLWFARHDHFKMDRKIEYALLLVAAFVGFWSQVGVYITIP